MKDPRSFFQFLRKRLEQKPDRNFDQRFWANFDLEFGSPKESSQSIFLRWKKLFPVTAVAGLLIAVVAYQKINTSAVSSNADLFAAQDLNENVDLYEDLDFFEGIDEIMLTASDEDWDYLLGTEGEVENES